MSAATRSTASSTSSTSKSPTPADARRRAPRRRFAWCVTGSGHYLEEALAVAARLPALDLFLSAAAAEVLPMYGIRVDELRARLAPRARIVRDKTASAVPVGRLYEDIYHTVVVAPATSNTVAKCVLGLSDTLPTNLFAQAGKLEIPTVVFACDTEPVVVTRAPHDWVTLKPRTVELEHVARLAAFAGCTVVRTPAELEAALGARLAQMSLTWNTSSS